MSNSVASSSFFTPQASAQADKEKLEEEKVQLTKDFDAEKAKLTAELQQEKVRCHSGMDLIYAGLLLT